MNALKSFKQKGRLLRTYLAELFDKDVTLANAYEALAASEGTTWNVLSARLAHTSDVSASVAQAATTVVLDTNLSNPSYAKLVRDICHAAYENACNHWHQELARGERCSYLIERGDLLLAMADYNVTATGEEYGEPEFEQSALNFMETKLVTFGYEKRACLLNRGVISLDEPFLGVKVFADLAVGDWFRDVEEGKLYCKRAVDDAMLYSTLGGKPGEPWYMGFNAITHVVQQVTLPLLPVEQLSISRRIENQPSFPSASEPVQQVNDIFTAISVGGIAEVNIKDLANQCSEEGAANAKAWIESNHTFAHRADTAKTWSYLVSVEKFTTMLLPHKVPPQLVVYFAAAASARAHWIMFYA